MFFFKNFRAVLVKLQISSEIRKVVYASGALIIYLAQK